MELCDRSRANDLASTETVNAAPVRSSAWLGAVQIGTPLRSHEKLGLVGAGGVRHVVNTSGGVCSFWAGERVVRKHGREGVVFLFADVLMEDDDLYRFLREGAEYLGVPITRVSKEMTPWELFAAQGMIGNSHSRCEREQLMFLFIQFSLAVFLVYFCVVFRHVKENKPVVPAYDRIPWRGRRAGHYCAAICSGNWKAFYSD